MPKCTGGKIHTSVSGECKCPHGQQYNTQSGYCEPVRVDGCNISGQVKIGDTCRYPTRTLLCGFNEEFNQVEACYGPSSTHCSTCKSQGGSWSAGEKCQISERFWETGQARFNQCVPQNQNFSNDIQRPLCQ